MKINEKRPAIAYLKEKKCFKWERDKDEQCEQIWRNLLKNYDVLGNGLKGYLVFGKILPLGMFSLLQLDII